MRTAVARDTLLLALLLVGGVVAAAPAPALPAKETPWRTASLASQGFDPAKFTAVDDVIRKDLPACRSLVVVRHGYLVFEGYYHRATAETKQDLRSVTKPIISTLIGIAIGRGAIRGVDEKVSDFFPEYITAASDPREQKITLRHCLTMTAGLDLDTFGPGPTKTAEGGWVGQMLHRKMASDPGKEFAYGKDGWPAHLASACVARATKMSTRAFAEQYLFGPLGIQAGNWNADPDGFQAGTGSLEITPRAMAKFGQLFLQNGRWEGRQVVPAAWVKQATSVQFGGRDKNNGEGFLWGVSDRIGYRTFAAGGYGGQLIFVVPDLDLVVVMTGKDRIFPDEMRDHTHVVRDYVLAAIKGAHIKPRQPRPAPPSQ